MSDEYVTSETNLPPDPEGEEITLQISDKDTREIFTTRARVSRNPDRLTDPTPLTVVKGPHENTEEQWYIDVLTADVESESVDRDLLRDVMDEVRDDANVINTRSDEVKTLLRYLVETGRYSSVSQASRTIMFEYLANTHPELVDEYVDLKVRFERRELLDDERGGA
ncbi:hypothetical protein [Halalkalicoccus sp. NIPERK01]|uniref:hypothetical protein n=1 Tax=Halalkalicoccus sp. NIPERK01 TaxID=3053469 RepID=UPI00256E9F42|nr:hypothetical protein [Halalkalicoccus sp. NIPERK01]MDL5360509.1 hypothetical protein [Halalkalicoccus sp. NIPERK01]